MPRDFEDYCWKDVIDPETLQIYQAYRRKIFVGDNPAVLAIDLYNKAYLGGDRPVREVDREFPGSCGENAWRAIPPTQSLFSAARRAGVPVIYTTRHVDTAGVHSTYRNVGRNPDDVYDIKVELAPKPGELVIVLVEECTYDRAMLNHKVNLFDLHHKYADVIHVEEVVAHLDGLAGARKVA
jgi:maleamate amidohydrolase